MIGTLRYPAFSTSLNSTERFFLISLRPWISLNAHPGSQFRGRSQLISKCCLKSLSGIWGGYQLAWLSLSLSFSFECILCEVQRLQRTVYVWLSAAQWHEKICLCVSLRVCTLRFQPARRAGRRVSVCFPFSAFCFLLDSFLSLLSWQSWNSFILFICPSAAQEIKAKLRLVKNCADRDLIGCDENERLWAIKIDISTSKKSVLVNWLLSFYGSICFVALVRLLSRWLMTDKLYCHTTLSAVNGTSNLWRTVVTLNPPVMRLILSVASLHQNLIYNLDIFSIPFVVAENN